MTCEGIALHSNNITPEGWKLIWMTCEGIALHSNNITPEDWIENELTYLGLSEIISEPTNFEPNKSPSSTDMIITDQSNLWIHTVTTK